LKTKYGFASTKDITKNRYDEIVAMLRKSIGTKEGAA
jgi:hypothetical protein